MLEYKVRAPDADGTGDFERILNEMAKDGWRLVSTTSHTAGTHRPRLYMFFEREVPERG